MKAAFFLAILPFTVGCSWSGGGSDTAGRSENTAVARGEAWYVTCQGCHGNAGEGLSGMHAPRLAGLSVDYIERQLHNYRSGLRGGPEDFLGVAMNGRAKALPDDQAVRDVAEYIGTLPVPTPAADDGAATPGGILTSQPTGAEYYETCVACHGASGEGNAELQAPALAGTDPAYLARQLRLYRDGIRGREGDEQGQQMRASVAVLPDDNAINAVARHASALR